MPHAPCLLGCFCKLVNGCHFFVSGKCHSVLQAIRRAHGVEVLVFLSNPDEGTVERM